MLIGRFLYEKPVSKDQKNTIDVRGRMELLDLAWPAKNEIASLEFMGLEIDRVPTLTFRSTEHLVEAKSLRLIQGSSKFPSEKPPKCHHFKFEVDFGAFRERDQRNVCWRGFHEESLHHKRANVKRQAARRVTFRICTKC
ncbi:MAG: hypothetical protein WB384_26245 [Candidatus Sulfotelmatobacter sp.]